MIRKTTEEFIEQAKKVHNGKYEYKGEYRGQCVPMVATCPIHGEFEIIPKYHLRGTGCKKCNGTERLTTETFIEKCKVKFGDLYDYTNTIYNGENEYITYICKIHGEVKQLPMNHLKYGCGKCGQEIGFNKKKMNFETFLKRAREIHGDRYTYFEDEYCGYNLKMLIYCRKCGKFFIQTPCKHLNGHGCYHCNESKLEKEIYDFLTSSDVEFNQQKKFKWLGRQSLDFYIPSKNIAIECQGEQHFKHNEFFGDITEFNKIKERDNRKRKLCEENGVKLLYFSNLHIVYPYKVYEDKEELLLQFNKI